MGIQERLKRARYGENGYITPKNYQIKEKFGIPHPQWLKNLNLQEIEDDIWDALANPYKDKYYRTNHKQIIDDFKDLPNYRKKLRYMIHNYLIRQLAYFILHPQQYNNNFENFAINWVVSSMFFMRTRILKNKYPNIRGIWEPSYNGLYPLYKPMLPKTTLLIAHRLHTILEPKLDKYLLWIEKKHGLVKPY